MRRRFSPLLAGSLLAVATLAAPATAATTGDAVVTFTVAGGELAITVAPVAAPLVVSGNTATGVMGLTTVTDTRVPGSTWTAQVKTTDFTATVPAAETIVAAKASMYIDPTPGIVTVLAGVTPATAHTSAGTALTLSTSYQNLVTTSAHTGPSTVTYIPTLVVDVTGANTGIYSGTITQSVV